VPFDVSNQGSDPHLLHAPAGQTYNRRTNTAVPLKFEHKLVKLEFYLKNDDWVVAPVYTDMDIAISDQYATGTLDLATGAVTPTGERRTLKRYISGALPFPMIVLPGTAEELKKVRLTFKNKAGEVFTLKVPSTTPTWEGGKRYTYTVTFNAAEKGSTITSDISDWEEGDEVNVDAGIEGGLLNGRITWDGSKSRYILTVDPANAGLYFRFGSVVGIFSGNHRVATLPEGDYLDQFDTGDVAWSPVGITDWASIPIYDGKTDFKLSPNTVTPELYHNAANVKRGKGDPCRLVGLDLAKIKNTPADQLTEADIDNGTWRLPTVEENQSFVGHPSVVNPSAHLYTLLGVPGAIFPDNTGGNLDRFLPIGGYRDTRENTEYPTIKDGEVQYVGWTHFWAHRPLNEREGCCMGYNRTELHPTTWGYYTYGFPVRCVRR